MLPIFYINNFKPWAPLPRKPFLPYKTSSTCFLRLPNSPSSMPSYNLPPSTLLLPKHYLPAQPLAEVCMLVIANTQPYLESNTFLEDPDYGAAFPCNPVPYIPAVDLISCYNSQDNTSISTKPPIFQGDYVEDTLSPLSISSLDNSLEEFFLLLDTQEDIPIDLIACPYPDPPTLLPIPPNNYQNPSRRDLPSFLPNTNPDQPCPSGADRNQHISRELKILKQKAQLLGGQEDTFTTLCSYFISIPLTNYLQFLSWLFKVVCKGVQGILQKRMPWSKEEVDLLIKLRKNKGRP
ncbi:uncharacterized protein BJX67DRAFT_372802 [Aspergillus lucknowensis]|uniref:Uncharacterized protein n=1 Tax=Aspergillus lucknowensis TaxID=176173 RepID=A0ABR4LNN5_9EURO